ncbi:collagen binding domain-containing protein [Streptomyces sp. HPF1205]|uniref:MSCRAMM family protein n=1 Tax=Streptomyces sp. HPF1205 TaxID=2873262 RepID=UPI001CEC2AB4|nr:carboxypeptidase-like regulatory domain-containing protein [Streptomyces sp. HPF1205]
MTYRRPSRLTLCTGVLGLTTAALALVVCVPANAATPTAAPSAPHSATPLDVVPGGITLHVTAPDNTPVPGAAFTLTDLAGTTAATGTTDPTGDLAFTALPAGIYHLRQTATGTPILQAAPDQDVVVPDGTTAPVTVTVTDPFTPAALTVRVVDRTGKPLQGAVVALTDPSGKAITVTTGHTGSAQASLPVTARTGTTYTATEHSGPNGVPAHSKPVTVRAEPTARIAVTLTDTTTPALTPPTPTPTARPTNSASTPPTPSLPTATAPVSPPGPTPPASATRNTSASRTQLAHTGADATTWLASTAGLLLVIGAGTLSGARYRRTHNPPRQEKN